MAGNWVLMTLLIMLLWGGADLFYKKGSDEADRYSHLKMVFVVGLAMGAHAAFSLMLSALNGEPIHFAPQMLITYFPVSAAYILSMALGYFGLRYLELSIASPVQNTSGAISFILLALFSASELREMERGALALSVVAVAAIAVGMVLLAVIEKRRDRRVRPAANDPDRKASFGVLAIFFPILYAVVDGVGTSLDGLYLGNWAGWIGMSETDVLYAYEFTFLIAGLLCFAYVRGLKKQKFSLLKEKDKGYAALLETAGQFFYVFAMSSAPIWAAPMIASYSIVSLLLSRVFLKETLNVKQYAAILLVLIGIGILGFTQGG